MVNPRKKVTKVEVISDVTNATTGVISIIKLAKGLIDFITSMKGRL